MEQEERIRKLEKEIYRLHRDTALLWFFLCLTVFQVVYLILR